jgi:hypothetical protein
MIYLGVPLQEGFVNAAAEPSTWSKIYDFFIGTSNAHIIGYVVLGILIFGGLGFRYASQPAVSAPIPVPAPQAGGKRRGR